MLSFSQLPESRLLGAASIKVKESQEETETPSARQWKASVFPGPNPEGTRFCFLKENSSLPVPLSNITTLTLASYYHLDQIPVCYRNLAESDCVFSNTVFLDVLCVPFFVYPFCLPVFCSTNSFLSLVK